MALQSSSPEDLIVIDSNYKERIEIRRRVMDENPSIVMGTVGTPASKAVVDELYSYLMDYLPARYPSIFQVREKSLYNIVTEKAIPCTPPADPIEAFRTLGETVEDDLFLLKEEDICSTDEGGPAYPENSHRLIAFLCCFPSGFDPSSKLGLLLKDIHRPVPSYEKIGPSMERFFKKVAVGQSVRRLNTYLFPLQDLKDDGIGPDLADAIEGLKAGNAPGMWTYKGGVRWGT
ncbi:hypothetical protein SBRCBS47491_006623 [Sporothrix bragantina]|uniref:Uncharacterized protein n=1 Tax=Sporothrix bragantina TaxID=671064 RepID=A0ABP0C6F4_9PEZI